MGATFPPLPGARPAGPDVDGAPALQDLAALEICRGVDLHNVLPVAAAAARLGCRTLARYCESFVRANLDGVLAAGSKGDLASFLSATAAFQPGETRDAGRDGPFHPLLWRMANSADWIGEGRAILAECPGMTAGGEGRQRRQARKRARRRDRAPSVREEEGEAAVSEAEAVSAAAKTPTKPAEPAAVAGEDAVCTKVSPDVPDDAKKPSGDAPPPAGRFHCSVCGVSCPDGDSLALHVNGRRHRNRLAHARAEEERAVADDMMAAKQMRLMRDGRGPAAASPPSAAGAATPSWPAPARAASSPSNWAPIRAVGSKSFQDILREEQGRSAPAAAKSPPPSAALRTPRKPSGRESGPSPSLSLGSFLRRDAGPGGRDAVSSAGATWASPGAVAAAPEPRGAGASPAGAGAHRTSFSAIQREEESRRGREDSTCRLDGSRWYVGRRERAASIGQIQEQERREREMAEMIEEQREIEEEIRRRLKREGEDDGDDDDGRRRRGRRRRQGKGGGKGAGQQHQGRRQKKKSAEFKKETAR